MGASIKREHSTARKTHKHEYRAFDRINGKHPLQSIVPEMCVMYAARKRHGAEVAYFNFDLAKEMGLIPASHSGILNADLADSLIDSFSLVIINEYDIENKIQFPKNDIKPHKYMATRYLQLQHPNKNGKTSGDGRSIWNGAFTGKGKTWDVSSCGTGATCLSPAAALYQKNFKTGDSSVSYGCGLADYPDALAAALMSEIFHRNKYPTERTLAILRYKDGTSINVRAEQNLVRPAHLFRYLKTGDYENLKNITDYYIEREKKNGRWNPSIKTKDPYAELLDIFTHDFARSAALFEREYIFCWLDWDGDNILMSEAAILDYGSVRQFGLFHKEYRYDDVERWSTTILEQKSKARYLVQTFAQLIDFLQHKQKTKVPGFANCTALTNFEKHFQSYKQKFLLRNVGFTEKAQSLLLKKHPKKVRHFQKLFESFERIQSQKGIYKVDDGITSDAVFCMRDVLRELPRLFLARPEVVKNDTFIEIAKSSYAADEDLKLDTATARNILNFQKSYLSLISLVSTETRTAQERVLLEITMRSSIHNRPDRVTGNGIIRVSAAISKARGAKQLETLRLLPEFIRHQVEAPTLSPRTHNADSGPTTDPNLRKLFRIVKDSREEI